MTPEEMRQVLLEEARWWADKPEHSEAAAKWVTFFEQLPEDNAFLRGLASEYEDADAFRSTWRRPQLDQFLWNALCGIFEKASQTPPMPERPDAVSN
jgi:hypothetical protein